MTLFRWYIHIREVSQLARPLQRFFMLTVSRKKQAGSRSILLRPCNIHMYQCKVFGYSSACMIAPSSWTSPVTFLYISTAWVTNISHTRPAGRYVLRDATGRKGARVCGSNKGPIVRRMPDSLAAGRSWAFYPHHRAVQDQSGSQARQKEPLRRRN